MKTIACNVRRRQAFRATGAIPRNNDMRFEVTTKCNYNCVICPHESMTRKQQTMSLGLFKKLFDKIMSETDQYDTLTFPGMGEPLLDQTLIDKIMYAKKKKEDMPVLILTNGSLLTMERFRQLEEIGVTSIRVSLYGTTYETYSRVHGIKNRKVFQKVMDNLLRIADSVRKTDLLLTYNVVDGCNDESVNDWIRTWQDRADLVEVWRPHNWVDGKKYRDVQDGQLKTCGRPFNGPLQIQVDGTVNMCCFDYDGKLTLGDLKTQSLKQIFSSPLYRKMIRCHSSGNYKGSGLICKKCDQRNRDKSSVMVYNSRFDVKERVKMISTTYKKVV